MLLESLQLGQGDDVAALGSVPHSALGGGVVIVETRGVRVKQLPPLVLPSPLNPNTLWRVPHALPRQQVGVHTLPRTWLDDFHPLQPAGEESRVRL